jgi:pimeloyl-ACP methyl ester carboxylesterase
MKTSMKFLLPVLIVLVLIAWSLWTPDRDRAALESKYLAAPGDLLMIGGVRLHIRDSGPRGAPAVLLLHGFGSSLHTWDAWSADLSRDLRVIRIDLPGSGLSSPDPTGRYTDARTIELIIGLLDRLEVAKISLVGNSIGGRIAWTFAGTQPQRIERLVLISPDGFASPGFAYGQSAEVPMSVQLMRFTLPKWLLRMSLAPAYADPSTLTDALTERYHALMLGPGSRNAMIARMQQTVLEDPLPVLRQITAPTMVLWGKQDGMIPFANAADYLQAIAKSTLVSLDGIGHVPQEEAPERSLIPVRAFLLETIH